MINNYSLHYSYKTTGDVLFIVIKDENVTRKENKSKDVLALYHDDELIGIHISNISKIMKIKSQGMIYLPSNALIDVINSLLENAKLEKLAYQTSSGYIIGKVESIDDCININIGSRIVRVLNSENGVNINDKVVVKIQGTNCHLCSYKDLDIEDKDDILIIEDDVNIGSDFFSMEEK